MKKSLLLLLLLPAMSLSSVAQTVTVYDAYNSDVTINKRDVKSDINNYVQWNMSMLVRGAFQLAYERKINDYFGIEVGAGPTLFDPIFYASNEMLSGLSDQNDNFKYKVGIMLSASAKFYPKQMVDFEGLYIAPSIRFRNYNYDSRVIIDYSNDISKTYSQSLNAVDYAFIIGYQYEAWSEITWNTYVGFAWSEKTFGVIDDTTHEPKKINDSGALFLVGLSLGITF